MANTYSVDLEASSSQYIQGPINNTLTPTNLTLEQWVKFESLPSSGNFMALANKGNMSTAGGYAWYLWNDGGTLKLLFAWNPSDGGSPSVSVNWTPSTATWYYVATTFDGTNNESKFYVGTSNSAPAQQGSTQAHADTDNMSDDGDNFRIGAANTGSVTRFLDGIVDEIRVSNIVRSGTYFDDYNTEITPDANHVLYWKLNEGTGTTVEDSTANNLDGTLQNSATWSTDIPFSETAIKKVSGVTIAYVKKIASVAIANVKKLMGVE